MLISLENAQELITPDIAAKLAYCSGMAFRDWFKEVTDSGRATSSPGAKAYFINDRMLHHAKTVFDGSNEVKLIPKHGRYQLMVKGQLLFKLKKLNRNFRTANIPTNTVILYDAQLKPPVYNTQLAFMNFVPDDITHLIAGYVEDQIRTGMSPYIVCPNGKRNYWVWPLKFTPMAPDDIRGPDDDGSDRPPKPVLPRVPAQGQLVS
ncbi:MAG: hypothetical protein AAB834_05510 [Patescibacteria group bacterium]|mgnify:CR=1 FL=1